MRRAASAAVALGRRAPAARAAAAAAARRGAASVPAPPPAPPAAPATPPPPGAPGAPPPAPGASAPPPAEAPGAPRASPPERARDPWAVAAADKPGAGLGFAQPPSRAPLYAPSPLTPAVARYYWLFRAMGAFSERAERGGASEALFRSVEEQATQEAWWRSLGLPRSWLAEHALVALHVWVLHCRLKVDYNVPGRFNGRRMQEELFGRLWEDTTLRIRNAGVAEVSVNKQLESVQKLTFDDMFGYDAALGVEGDEGLALGAAVWRGVFREDEGADTEAVLRLADYARDAVCAVALQPAEDVYRG